MAVAAVTEHIQISPLNTRHGLSSYIIQQMRNTSCSLERDERVWKFAENDAVFEYLGTVNTDYNECGGQSKSNEFGRIRYNQDDRHSDRGSGRGSGRNNDRDDRWDEHFIFLDNLIQIQVYFQQHLLKIFSDATCLFRSHSLLSIKQSHFQSIFEE